MTTTPLPILVLDEFLTEEERETLLTFVRNQSDFEPAMVTEPGALEGAQLEHFRRASVTTPVENVFELFEDKLRAVLPHARRETEVGYFPLGKIERQITSHRDGDFFGPHNDLGDLWSPSGSRRLSFVYYFHGHPRTFEGGELRVYDHEIDDDGNVTVADTFQTVEPNDNSIVFFPSHGLHEVRPVTVSGDPDAPGAQRYTLNGWFHARDHVRPVPEFTPEMRTALTQRFTPSLTDIGYKKIATPKAVHAGLRAVYDERLDRRFAEASDATYLPTGDPEFIDIDDVKGEFHQALQSVHEEWSGVELIPTAAYGLRVYGAGQTLIPHTDTLETHVISSIVHLAHDTDEPWPLWIVDLEGNEHNIVLEEGEMLLYESARCPHARPVPLRGRSYCSMFLHYKPVDWDINYWTLIDRARAEGAIDVLPEELWPSKD